MSTNEEKRSVTIIGQFVKDLSFEHPNPIISQSLPENEQPNLNIDVSVSHKALDDEQVKLFEVVLSIKIQAKHHDQTFFLLELAYAGYVSIDIQTVPQEQIESILLVGAPHMLFPFARAIVYSTMRDGGLPPFLMNPIDFGASYEEKTLN